MTTPPDPALRALLRRADPAADLPALAPGDFAAGVHARLLVLDSPPPHAFARMARQLFPLAASLAVLASIGAGSAVAYAREREVRADSFATAYARNIDPWQKHAAVDSSDAHAGHHAP